MSLGQDINSTRFRMPDPGPHTSGQRPIERYVRLRFELSCGVVEVGVAYSSGENITRKRVALEVIAKRVSEAYRSPPMSIVDADQVSADIDKQLVDWFGDVPRFIEVWRNDDDPLTQWYAPHRVPVAVER